jgi:hypothetical protein
MKQTAVEWLVEQIFGDHTSEWQKQINQAKTIENKQVIEFGKIVADKWGMIPVPLENIEDTYNETFKSK